LEEPIILESIPLIIPEIVIRVKVIFIDTITHAFEVFRTLDIVLKDTLVVERPRFKPIPLVELVNIIGEKLVDGLATCVK
jgi:hypothetical protein